MKEMILLGAGASVEAGVPDTVGMAERIVELFAKDSTLARYSHVLRFAIGGLLFQKGVKGENPFLGVNIEDVFNAIQILSERHDLEAAPFIGSWHPLVDKLDVIRTASSGYRLSSFLRDSIGSTPRVDSYAIDRALEDLSKGRRPFRSVGSIISDAFRNNQPLQRRSVPVGPVQPGPSERPGEGEIFEETNDRMIRKLVDLVWIEDALKVAYLKPLFSPTDQPSLVVATLNYDNAFELAGQSLGTPIETGIQAISQTGRFPIVDQGVYLLKLHGSIDWSLQQLEPSPEKPLSSQVIQRVAPDAMRTPGFRPAVVFGQKNKLTAVGPFLDLLAVFREQLAKVDRLTVVGYSFRDEHINEYIALWLNADQNRKLRIINGEKFAPTPQEFAHRLLALQTRVQLINATASIGIRDCFSQTQLEIRTSSTNPPAGPLSPQIEDLR